MRIAYLLPCGATGHMGDRFNGEIPCLWAGGGPRLTCERMSYCLVVRQSADLDDRLEPLS